MRTAPPANKAPVADRAAQGIRAVRSGIVVNAALAAIKLVAGIVGNAYALVADAVESTADIFASAIVWGGLQVATRDPDDAYPFGYGKAEALATSVVGVMLLGAALGIAIEAVREIRTPHHAPAPWTLAVLVAVMIVKWVLARRVRTVGAEIGSTAVAADASHHFSDALTSAAAFIGITIALVGGPGWESADDWAAIAASIVICYNAVALLRPALDDLMDRMPDAPLVREVRATAGGVPGVLAVEKLLIRTSGIVFHCEIHVQADAALSLDAAHALGGRV
jgi:cation diffusion facilitator family transporter